MQADVTPQPYKLGAAATADGAKLTVTHLFEAMQAKDDAAYDRIGRGMVVMVAPDMALPVTRTSFEQSLSGCTTMKVVSSRAFPKMPEAQAVRISMRCQDEKHPKGADASADIMADNEHVFMVFPGGVEEVWPKAGKN
jgi:hypothetical protein